MFAWFRGHLEKTCLGPGQKVQPVVLLFHSDWNPNKARQGELMRDFRARYPRADKQVLPGSGEFFGAGPRGGGLTVRQRLAAPLLRLDRVFTAHSLQRRRRAKTVRGLQGCSPILSSQ